ncbi:MAG: S49 family peptidase, partial [Methylotenera sp.]
QDSITDRFAKRLGASMAKAVGVDAMVKGVKLR